MAKDLAINQHISRANLMSQKAKSQHDTAAMSSKNTPAKGENDHDHLGGSKRKKNLQEEKLGN